MEALKSNKDFSASFNDAYSFDRVSSIYWSAFANQLIDMGYSEAAAREWIFSKGARWMLDSHDSKVEKLAKKMAQDHAESFMSIAQCEKLASESNN